MCEIMVYIRPILESDNRRWLGFLSTKTQSAKHNHPMPVESKLGSQLSQDLEIAVKRDPTKTTSEIQLGIGLGFMPMCKSTAAANKETVSHYLGRCRSDYSGAKAQDLIKQFDVFIRNRIDEEDSVASHNLLRNCDAMKRCSPYLR